MRLFWGWFKFGWMFVTIQDFRVIFFTGKGAYFLEELIVRILCNRSNTRKSVSSDFQTPRSRLEKRGAAEFFSTNLEVFGNRRKHSFECLI